jgi:hypothetical protein
MRTDLKSHLLLRAKLNSVFSLFAQADGRLVVEFPS